MDYKEKYEKALSVAKKWKDDGISDIGKVIECIFPELVDEDEKNIKRLINELKGSLRAANCQNDACGGGHESRIKLLEWGISWLEKQNTLERSKEKISQIKTQIALCNGFNRENRDKIFVLLDSLYPLPNWKPSKEQIEALRIAAEVGTANNSWAMEKLKELYNDLQKI